MGQQVLAGEILINPQQIVLLELLLFTFCSRLKELTPLTHPFWENTASYTFKNLFDNYFARTEHEIIVSLLMPRLKTDHGYFILNLGSGYPRDLINLLLDAGSKYYLVNIDISSRIIAKTDEYCEKNGFQQDDSVFSRDNLSVENIRADITSLVQIKNRSKLRSEIKNEYPGIFILALNSLQNLHVPGDEGLSSVTEVLKFFNFADAFFVTLQSFSNAVDRLAYYQRRMKVADLVQLRMVSCSRNGTINYGKKFEKKLNFLLDNTEPDIRKLLAGNGDHEETKGVIVDFLSSDCQHTGCRTVLVSPVFANCLFSSTVPEFSVDLCGYPEYQKPPSSVLVPVAGKKEK